jgi:hyaluronan synthase
LENALAATPRSVPLAHSTAADWFDILLIVAILTGIAAITYHTLQGGIFDPVLRAATRADWAQVLLKPSVLWVAMGTLLLAFRTWLWWRYRPYAPATMDNAPSLTVIIPAYNEGAMVAQSIDSVAGASYPRDRLEIFVIDDGSHDDTWEHILAAARRYPDLVTPLRFSANRGKRAALETGFRQARGEIVVTIDSDSVIEPQTLLAIAGPFRHRRIGAVAGKVAAHNRNAGIIPRMLHVRFVLSFDMLRAAQSTYGTVYCTPGALSAYRTSVVRDVLHEWLNQTFMGVPCTFGEDRALTNLILTRGYDSVYQRPAVVHTIVPTTYSKLCKMYLRWDRSYVREEFRFLSHVVWSRPWRARLISLFDTTITNLRYPVSYLSLALLVLLIASDPMALIRVIVVIGVMSAFYMLYYLRSERSLDFVYGILYSYFAFFALFWIFPYAVATVRARSWMTR